MQTFSDISQLEGWLTKYVDISSWGENSKGLEDLWQEYRNGECILEERESQIIRTVQGVGACLWRPASPGRSALFLQETEQRFKSGHTLYRDLEMSIGEKCLRDEDPKQALARAFKEELEIEVSFELKSPLEQRTLLASDSYPGTLREYRTHLWHLMLPEEVFKKEYREEQAKKTNIWHWRRLPYGVEMPPMNGAILTAQFLKSS